MTWRIFSVFWLAIVLTAMLPVLHVAAQEEEALLEIDPGNFDPASSINISNEYYPLRPGTKYVYEGSAISDEGEEIERKIEFVVTDLVKKISGINAVVLWITDYNDDELIETELAFFAQDNDGNVWGLGEYVEIWDEDGLVGGHTWLVNVMEGAKAGVNMWAKPEVSDSTYSLGFAPAPINWTDRARVSKIEDELCIETKCYKNVIVIEEGDKSNPDAAQLKYYAPGVGNIKVGFAGEDPEQEELELVDLEELDEDEVAEARAEALALEARAYLYSKTPPATQR